MMSIRAEAVQGVSPPPYLGLHDVPRANGQKVFFEVYGCPMNTNDTEIVSAVMSDAGYARTEDENSADVLFLVTCAIRENAEKRVWNRLEQIKLMKSKRPNVRVGVLGCMAERLKTKLIETDKLIDVVCGPDAYRDLPRLLSNVENTGQPSVNVVLSLEETYADITPVRLNQDKLSAYVSVMRGCDNMCSFCVVPFTRGRERSRPMSSVVDEVRKLYESGVKEVTVLGQNVNSYRDMSLGLDAPSLTTTPMSMMTSRGFRSIYKPREGGLRFADLLDKVASVSPDLRIRFTSPHPKDFPDELLALIQERPNIAKSIHLPAQSGSTNTLARMRRGYTRKAYLDLVAHIRSYIPDVALSTDLIVGFCGETEEEHQDTLSLVEQVGFDTAFMFAYSLREKTHAHRNYIDDVPQDVKDRRLQELIKTFHEKASLKNRSLVGKYQVVLIEGRAARNADMDLTGRADCNRKVNFEAVAVPFVLDSAQLAASSVQPAPLALPQKGDVVLVEVSSTTSLSLRGKVLARTTITAGSEIARLHNT